MHSSSRFLSWAASSRSASLAASLAVLAGCAHPAPDQQVAEPQPSIPTERMAPVFAVAGPIIGELEDDEPASRFAAPGELLYVKPTQTTLRWKANMDGKPIEREGPVVEVRSSLAEGRWFGFASDLGPEIDVPSAAWICAQWGKDPGLPVDFGASPACAGALSRIRAPDGSIVAIASCGAGACPIGVLRDGRLSSILVEDLNRARAIVVGAHLYLLATRRWTRAGGAWSGATLTPILVGDGAALPLADIPLEDLDTRDPAKVVSRDVRFQLETGGATLVARVTGERKEVDRATGRVLASAPIAELATIGGPEK